MSDPGSSELPALGTRYRVLRRLGMGNSGELYLVQHRELGKKFVAKILRRRLLTDREHIARFGREAKVLGQMQHPNIVGVVDFAFTTDQRPFIVLEYLLGKTLAEELRDWSQMTPIEALSFARQALQGLAAAHEMGIVHRDVKPANLFLHSPAGKPVVLKVLDFGAARDVQGIARVQENLATNTGTVIGTLSYMSPEQAQGHRVDASSDVYSLGLVLCVMLTGQMPLGGSPQSSARPLLASDLDLPASLAGLRAELEQVLLKALARDPVDRFENAGKFLAALLRT